VKQVAATLSEMPPQPAKRSPLWAGSRIKCYQPLKVEADVACIWTILNAEEKHGRTRS
jgi:hydroxyacyl-ACP dehydratase HTD2-like protein with hotdog domain